LIDQSRPSPDLAVVRRCDNRIRDTVLPFTLSSFLPDHLEPVTATPQHRRPPWGAGVNDTTSTPLRHATKAPAGDNTVVERHRSALDSPPRTLRSPCVTSARDHPRRALLCTAAFPGAPTTTPPGGLEHRATAPRTSHPRSTTATAAPPDFLRLLHNITPASNGSPARATPLVPAVLTR
jgi:hypothetical protein